MANAGSKSPDMTFAPGPFCLTTTAQFSIVCGGTNTASYQPEIAQTTTSYSYPLGVIQNRMTSNALSMTVRTGGFSKVLLLDSVSAFQYLKVAASGTCSQFTLSSTQLTVTTANQVFRGVIGKSMEDGRTGSVVEAIILPQLMFGQGI